MAKRKKESVPHGPVPPSQKPASRSKKPRPEGVGAASALIEDTTPVQNKASNTAEWETRTFTRRPVRVPTIVHFRETEEDSWKELTQITTVTRSGAALVLSRPCPVGRLVSLVMQMPQELRAYDHNAPVYPMVGVVQNCYASTLDERPIYHVGVAFIGKDAPKEAESDPKKCYRIIDQTDDGLWEFIESDRDFQSRKNSRLWRRFKVTVSLPDELGGRKEQVFTREVSSGGMSVWGPLDVNVGDRVKVSCKQYDFDATALVRNRTEHESDDTKSLVHMEFEGAEFPVARISVPEPPDPGSVKAAKGPEDNDATGDEDEVNRFSSRMADKRRPLHS